MNTKAVMKVAIIFLGTVGTCWAGGCTGNSVGSQVKGRDVNSVEAILRELNRKTAVLKSYEGRIEYRFSQPILESETLRKGALYYAKCNGKSALRINFQTLKQDDEEEQAYIEHYLFDGVWLTVIDYQIKEVKLYQLAEANEPVDAFELVSKNFPIIGFSKAEDLKREFEIKLVEQAQAEPSEFIHLHLKVKPDSIYKDDYTSVDFWIDKELYLPARIVAVSAEEDIYQIRFLDAKVNEKLERGVFDFKIPEGFGEPEIIPLKKTKKGN